MGRTYYVAPNKGGPHTVLVQPMPNLVVTVIAEDGSPVAGANVHILERSFGHESSGETDEKGVLTFAMPEGSYSVRVEKDGFVAALAEAEVPALPAKATTTVRLQRFVIDIEETSPIRPTHLVGHRITLAIRSTPPGAVFTDIEWKISPETVKSYTRSQARAERVDLAPADLKQKTVSFYWISSGAKSVSATVKMGGAQLVAEKIFDVEAPKLEAMSSKTTTFSIGPAFKSRPEPWLIFQRSVGEPGITWTFKATLPAGGQGRVTGTQLVSRHYQVLYNDKMAGEISTRDEWWLDGTPEYEDMPDGSDKGDAGSPVVWRNEDAPGLQLVEGLEEGKVDTKFKIYFMYKALPATYDDSDTIWVTLGRLEWYCRASTRRVGNKKPEVKENWSAPAGVAHSQNPSGSPSTELPTWTRFVPRAK